MTLDEITEEIGEMGWDATFKTRQISSWGRPYYLWMYTLTNISAGTAIQSSLQFFTKLEAAEAALDWVKERGE